MTSTPGRDDLMNFRLEAGWTIQQMARVILRCTVNYRRLKSGVITPDRTDIKVWNQINSIRDHGISYEKILESRNVFLF